MGKYGWDDDDRNDIFDNGEDDGIDYSDLDEYDEEEAIEEEIAPLRGTIEVGDCIMCGAKLSAVFNKECNCFYCSECHYAVDEDFYLMWLKGFHVEIE